MRIRLLPLIVIFSLALFGVKVYNVLQHNSAASDLFLVAESRAKSAEEAPAKEEAAKEEKTTEKKDGKAAEGKTGEQATEEAPKAEEPEQPKYSDEELELLKNLTKRREELDSREKDISLQAIALEAAAKKMDDRAKELKKLEEEASLVINDYLKKDKTKIMSLVKIYENMKPKDAARIFETMEMPILLEVVSNMKEAKAAPILAKMKPENAKNITTQLAEKRRLPEPDNSYRN